jgi:hypothetical protein
VAVKRAPLLLVAAAVGFGARPARADLGNDVERVVLAYSAFGHVTRLRPRLLERGETLPLVLPPDALDLESPGCATVVLLGTTGTSFLLDAARARLTAGHGGEEPPEGSLAGALSLGRCGPQKLDLGALAIQMRSPRGVVESLLVTSTKRVPPLPQVLPHRDPGPLAPVPGPGPRPRVMPLSLRLRALEERAAREGALEVARQELSASAFGMGTALVTLGPGCHRFDLVSDEAGERSADVDFEVLRADTGERLAEDQSESSDAFALVCAGTPMVVSIRFAGASPFARLELLRARWDLEAALPRRFSPDVRARISAVLRNERLALPGARLADEALGVQGDTQIALEVEPFACYVAVVVGLRGEATMLALGARTSRGDGESRMGPEVPGAALGFCAGPETRALFEVQARGHGLVWMSALFQQGRLRPGAGDE